MGWRLTSSYSRYGALHRGGRRRLQTRTGNPRGAHTARWRSRRAPWHRHSRPHTWWAPAGRRVGGPAGCCPSWALLRRPQHSCQTCSLQPVCSGPLLAELPLPEGLVQCLCVVAGLLCPLPKLAGAPGPQSSGSPTDEQHGGQAASHTHRGTVEMGHGPLSCGVCGNTLWVMERLWGCPPWDCPTQVSPWRPQEVGIALRGRLSSPPSAQPYTGGASGQHLTGGGAGSPKFVLGGLAAGLECLGGRAGCCRDTGPGVR